jgi:hypothetical protein
MSNTKVKPRNSSTVKSTPKSVDIIESVELDGLKTELDIVKKALEDQQKLVKDLEDTLKAKKKLLDEKDMQIESLKHTISKLK